MKPVFFILLVLLPACSGRQDSSGQKSAEHRCANCGMKTALYPRWEQLLVARQGDSLFFCGPRCMFAHVLSGETPNNTISKAVTLDYYTQKKIDPRRAWFVTGSDVTGPMGNELIPFDDENSAMEFMRDHHGKRILRWDEVNSELVKNLAGGATMK